MYDFFKEQTPKFQEGILSISVNVWSQKHLKETMAASLASLNELLELLKYHDLRRN